MPRSNQAFSGKVALITGSGRGIGRAIAERFADAGARVVVTSNVSTDVARAVSAIRRRGGDAMGFTLDLREQSEVDRMIRTVVRRWKRIDILVNNAARFPRRVPFLKVSFRDWTDIIDVNLFCVFRITQLVARTMVRTRTPGRIVNISSLNASRYRVGTAGQTQYNASKAALNNLTMGLAMELAPYGIIVNGIAPGFVRTALSKKDRLLSRAFRRDYLQNRRIPLGRYALPDDCAKLVLFLASEECAGMTGEIIQQDGGLNFVF